MSEGDYIKITDEDQIIYDLSQLIGELTRLRNSYSHPKNSCISGHKLKEIIKECEKV